ncbi:gag/pol protein [Cucumis melo var. makuwa]|uniref:Gag/pol protein n=1 Tax=Cucumis melo var. makuwa TaxID=1194695 RepID=A0A5A7UZQ2_CUCMM|nr:gag/pol protein [Cucumis melo var. makuwa]
MGKGMKVETNIVITKKELVGGSSSKTSVGPSQMNKGKRKTPKNNIGKKVANGKCYHYNQDRHWLRNCPKYLAEKKAEKEAQGQYDLLAVEMCL